VRPLWFLVGLAIPAGVLALLLGFRGPDTRGVRIERVTLRSRLVHRDLHELLVRPQGAAGGRPLLVLLHGRGSSPSAFLQQGLAPALRALGPRAPDVLLADGGESQKYLGEKNEPIRAMSMIDGKPAAYVCQNFTCKAPVTDPKTLGGLLTK